MQANELRGETEVEDVMQEAYVSAFQHLAQYDGSAAFSTWLVRIAINAALARLRGRRRLTSLSFDFAREAIATLPRVPEPERQAAAREAAALLERAFDALPELYRTVFMLREMEEMDTAECASVLGVSGDVVKTRLRRARVALRQHLLRAVGTGRARPSTSRRRAAARNEGHASHVAIHRDARALRGLPRPASKPPLGERHMVLRETVGHRVHPALVDPGEEARAGLDPTPPSRMLRPATAPG